MTDDLRNIRLGIAPKPLRGALEAKCQDCPARFACFPELKDKEESIWEDL